MQYYTNRFSSKEYSFVDTPVLQSKMKSAAIDNGDGTVSFTAGEYTVANNRSTSVRLGSLIKDAYSFTDEEKTLVISVKSQRLSRFPTLQITELKQPKPKLERKSILAWHGENPQPVLIGVCSGTKTRQQSPSLLIVMARL